MNQLQAALAAKLNQAAERAEADFAPALLLTEGEEAVGTVEGIDWKQPEARPDGTVPEEYPIVTLIEDSPRTSSTRDGQQITGNRWAIHLNSKAGRDAMAGEIRNGPVEAGDGIGIRRLTDKPNPHGGANMRIYVVSVVRQTQPQTAPVVAQGTATQDTLTPATVAADPARPF